MRPDNLSYLVDVEGKILVRARNMLRPAEKVRVFEVPQVLVHGGAQAESEVGVLPRRSEWLKEKKDQKNCFNMCPLNDDAAKLREYRRLDRLHREQIAEEMQIESESNTIRQNSGEFSLVNVQWASFATGVSAIFVVAIIALAVLVCCWLRAKGQRLRKHHHRQLLSTSLRPSCLDLQQGTIHMNHAAPEFVPQSRQSGSGRCQAGQA